ncbi:MAG: hypothetical protein P8010_11035 [Desulfosarcinaceae bacterium]
MTQKPLTTLTLDNQLTLNLFDASRKIAGDRWRVEIVLQIDIPVSGTWFGANPLPAPLAEVKETLGETVRFEYRDRRAFVDAGDKDALLAKMQADLLAMAPRYYGHPDFAARYITKTFVKERHKSAYRYGGR